MLKICLSRSISNFAVLHNFFIFPHLQMKSIYMNQAGRILCGKDGQSLEVCFNLKVSVVALMIWKTILLTSLGGHVAGGCGSAKVSQQ